MEVKVEKNITEKQIVVTHSHPHSVETLWKAYTDANEMEQWWAPEPYKAIVVNNDFKVGGNFFYYMLAPDGQKHYCITEYLDIVPLKSYQVTDAFCDENGVVNNFEHQYGITAITNTLLFEKESDMEQLLSMGFEEGYRMGLNQLEILLSK